VTRKQHDGTRHCRHHLPRRVHAVAIGKPHGKEDHVGPMLVHEPDDILGATAVANYGATLETDGLGHRGPGVGMVIDDEDSPAMSCHAATRQQGECHATRSGNQTITRAGSERRCLPTGHMTTNAHWLSRC